MLAFWAAFGSLAAATWYDFDREGIPFWVLLLFFGASLVYAATTLAGVLWLASTVFIFCAGLLFARWGWWGEADAWITAGLFALTGAQPLLLMYCMILAVGLREFCRVFGGLRAKYFVPFLAASFALAAVV